MARLRNMRISPPTLNPQRDSLELGLLMSPYYVILSRLCTLAARGGLSGRIPWTSAPFVVTLSGGAPTLAILQAVVDDAVAVHAQQLNHPAWHHRILEQPRKYDAARKYKPYYSRLIAHFCACNAGVPVQWKPHVAARFARGLIAWSRFLSSSCYVDDLEFLFAISTASPHDEESQPAYDGEVGHTLDPTLS